MSASHFETERGSSSKADIRHRREPYCTIASRFLISAGNSLELIEPAEYCATWKFQSSGVTNFQIDKFSHVSVNAGKAPSFSSKRNSVTSPKSLQIKAGERLCPASLSLNSVKVM